MSRKVMSTFCLFLMAPFPRPLAADPRSSRSDWDQIQQLRPGDVIQVELRGAASERFAFGSVTPERMQLVRSGNQQLDVARADVLRVYRVRKRSGARAAAPLIGAAIGFGMGFGIGYATTAPKSVNGWSFGPFISRPVGGALVGAVGAIAGGVIGYFARGKSKVLVYRHP